MDRFILQTVVREWQQRELHTGTRRDLLDTLLTHVDEREALIVSGVRRCGKTTLLFQLVAELEKKVGRHSILYLNLEDERLLGFEVSDFERLLEVFQEERARAGARSGRVYVALDEVQEVAHWEKWVRRVYDQSGDQVKFLLTGSSSFILSSEFATLLSGRNLTFALRPFSFAEYLRFVGEAPVETAKLHVDTEARTAVQAHLTDYLFWGGFPAAAGRERTELLQQYFRDILFRDVASRHALRDVRLLERVAHYLFTNAGNLVSYNKLSQTIGGSKDTIREYVDRLASANLVFELPYFSYTLAEINRRNRKVYAIDTGLRNAVAFRFSGDTGRLAENVVFQHLSAQQPHLFYWADGREVDFVVDEHGEVDLVNVCLTDEIPEREWEALRSAPRPARAVRRRLLVAQTAGPSPDDIERVPLWELLLK